MKKKEPTMNYEIMFKSAVSKMKTDAQTYNALVRELAEIQQVRIDDEGAFIQSYDFVESVEALRTTLKMYKEALERDAEEVKKYRELKEKPR